MSNTRTNKKTPVAEMLGGLSDGGPTNTHEGERPTIFARQTPRRNPYTQGHPFTPITWR